MPMIVIVIPNHTCSRYFNSQFFYLLNQRDIDFNEGLAHSLYGFAPIYQYYIQNAIYKIMY